MASELDRILADLRRSREKLNEIVEQVSEQRSDREELLRAVDRIRIRMTRQEQDRDDTSR